MKVLEVEGLSKNFGGLMAVKDVSFHVDKCEIVSLIGPNGAGKTTVFNLITGFFEPTYGKIIFENEEMRGLKTHVISGKGVQRTFQKTEVFPEVTTFEGVMMGLHRYCTPRQGVLSILFNTKKKRATEEEAQQKALEIIEFTGLKGKEEFLSKNLSYGEQRLLEIAVAYAAGPRLLLLDEPTSGMNPEESKRAMDLIYKIREQGITILLVEHDMNVVMGISDRIIVLDYGEKIAEGLPSEIRENENVIKAYLGHGFQIVKS